MASLPHSITPNNQMPDGDGGDDLALPVIDGDGIPVKDPGVMGAAI